jgi:hypothetical protein
MRFDASIIALAREWKKSPQQASDSIAGIIPRIERTLKTLFGSHVIGFVDTGIPDSAIPERARKARRKLSENMTPGLQANEFRSHWLQNVFPNGSESDDSLIGCISRAKLALETIQADGGFPFRTEALLHAEGLLMAAGSGVAFYGEEVEAHSAGAFNELYITLQSESQRLARWVELQSSSSQTSKTLTIPLSKSDDELPFGITLTEETQTVSRFLPSIGKVQERRIPDSDQWRLLKKAIQNECKLTKSYVQTAYKDRNARRNVCTRLREHLECIQLTFGVPKGAKEYVLDEMSSE